MRAFINQTKSLPQKEWVMIMPDGAKQLLKAPTLTAAINQAKLYGAVEIASAQNGHTLAGWKL